MHRALRSCFLPTQLEYTFLLSKEVRNTDKHKMTDSVLHKPEVVTPLRRIASGTYDWLIIIALMIVCWIPVVMVSETLLSIEQIPGFLIYLYIILLSFAYFAYFWRNGGQTVGMKTWHIKLVTADNKPASLKASMLRYCGAIISLIPAGLGFLSGYTKADNACWHDQWSDSHLIRLEKKKKR